ncbi:MAG: dihydrodipicolinate synthase family protein [Acidobacteriaceae bacterium]
MDDITAGNRLDRRTFLQNVGMLGLGAAFVESALTAQVADAQSADVQGANLKTPSGKPLRGLYPIMETPFTPDDKLNTDALAAEVKWLNKGRVAGMIWPAWASAWATLSDAERIEGTEAMLAAGKGGKSAIVIEVQNNAWDTATAVRYAKHAAAHGADAIGAIPLNNGWNRSDQDILDYYKAIAAATDLPLIVQTRGTVSVDLMVQMFQQIPTMKATKDEVGDTIARAKELMQRTDNKLAVWAAGGGTGNNVWAALPLGIVGLCPTPQYAELLQQVMELYWAGKKSAAFDMFALVQTFASTVTGATGYMMEARGVFPEGTKSRPQPMEPEAQRAGAPAGGDLAGTGAGSGGGGGAAAGGGAGGGGRRGGGGGGAGAGAGGGRAGGGRGGAPLTDKDKENIKLAIDTYLKPYFRG